MSSWLPEIEREWSLSEVPAATVGEGGGNPQKDKDVP